MDRLPQPDPRDRHAQDTSAPEWLPALAGLATAAAAAWWFLPSHGLFRFPGLLFLSLRFVVVSALSGLVVASGVALAGERSKLPPGAISAIFWTPPLVLFLAHRSLWAGVTAVGIVWQLTRIGPTPGAEYAQRPKSARAASVPGVAAACAAVLIQSAAAAILFDWPLASIPLLATAAAFVAWGWKQYATASPRKPPSILRSSLPSMALAIVFTLLALLPYLSFPGTGGGAGPFNEQADDRAATDRLNGMYRGIILLPDIAPHPLVIPPLPFARHDLSTQRLDNPRTVPFFGVYWMYRFPQSQPPPGSYVVKGTPLTSAFRSSDRYPLTMEARQNFGKLIGMDCCSEIQVAVSSRDPNAATIALELILTNSTMPGFRGRMQSLGSLLVGPALERWDGDLASPKHGVLRFPMPARPMLREFDEITIVFQRAVRFESARIAIDSFEFVPKGLL